MLTSMLVCHMHVNFNFIIIFYCICIAVEQADDGASLHGLSVGNHHICVLLKMLVSFQ